MDYAWDKKRRETPLMTEDVGKREHPGVGRRTRRTYHDWMFCDAHPSKYGALSTPPPGVETWLKDVFGDRAKDLLVFMHPHLKRWCLGERHKDPRKGENIWQVIWICAEAARETEDGESFHVPSDYVGDRFLECFGQFVGEFKLPTKQDFVEIEAGDRKKYGVDQVCEMFQAREDAPMIEREKQFDAFCEDFDDYHFNMACDEANQRAGSGWHMRSVPTVLYKSNPERWHYADRGSYKERMRVGSRQHTKELKLVWDCIMADKAKFDAERGMQRGVTLTPEMRAEMRAEYEQRRAADKAGASESRTVDLGQLEGT